MTEGGERGRVLLTGLQILESLGEHKSLGITPLARLLGGDKGNLHRIVRILCETGYVTQDPVTRQYSLTAQIVQLAGRAMRRIDVREASEDILRQLASETGESSHLAVVTRQGGVYVDQVRASKRLSVETEIGSRPIVHATSTGKALYAYSSPEVLDGLLIEPLERFTSKTIYERASLDAEFSEVRRRGFAIDDEELNRDIRCVAAPVFDAKGGVTAALGVSGPVNRISHSRLDELGSLLRDRAREVTRRTGGEEPAGGGGSTGKDNEPDAAARSIG